MTALNPPRFRWCTDDWMVMAGVRQLSFREARRKGRPPRPVLHYFSHVKCAMKAAFQLAPPSSE